MPAARLATLIRHQLGVIDDLPLDPALAAERLGYSVVWADPRLLGPVDGMVIRDELHVAQSGALTRDRWTLAHELAHAEARRHGMDWRDDRLADQCAAELLLPSRLIALCLQEELDVPALAARCGVSYEAAARRVIEVAPGLAVATYGRMVRTYSTLPAPSRRLGRLGAALARRTQAAGQAKRIRTPRWIALSWPARQGLDAVSVVLPGSRH